MCPNVQIFRHGYTTGFAPLDPPANLVGVFLITLPNMNAPFCTASANLLGPPPTAHQRKTDTELYEGRLNQKFEMVLQGAQSIQADVVIISDAGIEELNNDPFAMGHGFGSQYCQPHGGGTLPAVMIAQSSSEFRLGFMKSAGVRGDYGH